MGGKYIVFDLISVLRASSRGISVRRICTELGYTERAIYRNLRNLEKIGAVERRKDKWSGYLWVWKG